MKYKRVLFCIELTTKSFGRCSTKNTPPVLLDLDDDYKVDAVMVYEGEKGNEIYKQRLQVMEGEE